MTKDEYLAKFRRNLKNYNVGAFDETEMWNICLSTQVKVNGDSSLTDSDRGVILDEVKTIRVTLGMD